MSEELKLCPMCTGKGQLVKYLSGSGYYFECKVCGLQTNHFKESRAAFKAWNTRATPWKVFNPEDESTWPEDDQYVLCRDDDRHIELAWFEYDLFKSWGVDYWMPIPEIKKGDNVTNF